MYGIRERSSRPPVHRCPGQSGNTRQVNSLRLIPGAVQQSLSHLPAVPRGGHFFQRLPDAQISPDDVVPLAAEHHQGRHAADAVL
ncbi:hypothetical protein BvCmsNSNP006_05257 [Escherichia coli]|nr:hypothetical protein BvCmsNSNP006_05257 [Escherichia coli]